MSEFPAQASGCKLTAPPTEAPKGLLASTCHGSSSARPCWRAPGQALVHHKLDFTAGCIAVGKSWTKKPGPKQINPISGNKIQSTHLVKSELVTALHIESTFIQPPTPTCHLPPNGGKCPFSLLLKGTQHENSPEQRLSLLFPAPSAAPRKPCLPCSSCSISMTLSPGQGAQLVGALSQYTKAVGSISGQGTDKRSTNECTSKWKNKSVFSSLKKTTKKKMTLNQTSGLR